MTRYNTRNAVPSSQVKDFYDNSQIVDEIVHLAQSTTVDRFGNQLKTWRGITEDANQAIKNYGYILLDSFEDGANITQINQVLRYKENGEYYRWDGSFPKSVPANSTPETTGGIGAGAWVGIADASLRSDLKNYNNQSGDALVAVKHPAEGSTDRTQHQKNQDVVSILDFGGIGDGTSYNDTALASAVAAVNGKGEILFPMSGSGVYAFSLSLNPNITNGVTLNFDAGTKLHVPDVGFIHKNCKFKNDVNGFLTALNDDYIFSSSVHNENSNRVAWQHPELRNNCKVEPIYPDLNGLYFLSYDQRNDSINTITPSYVSSSGFVVNNTDPYVQQYGMIKLKAGEEIQYTYSGDASSVCALIVETGTARYWVTCNATSSSQPFIHSRINGTSTISSSQIIYNGATTHLSYSFYNSVISLRVNNRKSFSILLNGYEIALVDTNDEIVHVGVGGSGQGNVTVSNLVKLSKNNKSKGRMISVSVFGDSITDESIHGSWPYQMRQIIDASEGIRVAELYNYAVSGASSAAQMQYVTPTNLAKSNVAILMLGVNDIQSGVDAGQYISNMSTMIETCLASGNFVIIGSPTMFYTQDQAGSGKGQASSNFDKGKEYRQGLLRLISEKSINNIGRISFVDTNARLGPVLADFVNSSLNPVIASSGADPVVFDNIHPTQNTKTLLGLAYSEALTGLLIPCDDLSSDEQYIPASYLSPGWSFDSQHPSYMRDKAGIVHINGIIDNTLGNPPANGDVIMTLPKNLRPVRDVRIPVSRDLGISMLSIESNTGQIKIYYMDSGTWISLDGVSYRTE